MEAYPVMRINLATNLKKGQGKALAEHLLTIYAKEFGTNRESVLSHLKSGDPQVGEYWAAWLRLQGWQTTWYNMPVPDHKYLDSDYGEWMPLSFGLLFAESCDKLILWKLSHT